MVLRAPFHPSRPTLRPETLCARCLRRLAKAPVPASRAISKSSAAKNAAAPARPRRSAFQDRYFWANGTLGALAKEGDDGMSKRASSASTAGPTASTNTPSNTETFSDAPTSQQDAEAATETLAHRRRKRRAVPLEPGPEPSIPLDASSRLSTLASTLQPQSLRRRLATYLSLSKPRLTFLIVLTTTASYSVFPVPALLSPTALATPSLSPLTLLYLTTGTFLASASANALNMLFEPSHDAKMSRTRNRPLVRNLISKRGALIFALVTGALGVSSLYLGVNPTTAFLGFANIVLYAAVYTPMKRLSVFNTHVGALVGGIPPLMGWTAAAGQSASGDGGWQELLLGPEAAGGWILAALLFCWQFPHFHALSHTIRMEYKNAGYRMLCWVNPASSARVSLRYSLLMFPLCYALGATGVTEWAFVGLSAPVNAWMCSEAVRFWQFMGAKGSARGLFWASVWHLPILLVLAMLCKKGLWLRVGRAVGLADDGVTEDWEEDDEEEVSTKEGVHGDGTPDEDRLTLRA